MGGLAEDPLAVGVAVPVEEDVGQVLSVFQAEAYTASCVPAW